MRWYLQALRNYAVFSGRARRKEYWYFFSFNLIFSTVIGGIAGFLEAPAIGIIYNLAVVIPSLGVGIRRMHDTDRSGWWVLLPIVNFVFWATAGTQGDNRFGPDPKATAASTVLAETP